MKISEMIENQEIADQLIVAQCMSNGQWRDLEPLGFIRG